MRLDECVTDATHIVSHPLTPRAPTREWTEPRDQLFIPEHLYRFYCLADYFALDRAPPFLADTDRLLFSFLSGLVIGIRESFEEAHSLVRSLKEDAGKGYSPIKEMTRREYDRAADSRSRRSFRYLIVSLASALDQFAEVVSVFFHGDIDGLTVGRASFAELRAFAREPFAPASLIVSPKESRFQQLHKVLVEELNSDGAQEHWFELFHLYRNKLAHLGSPMFPIISLHDRKGVYYSFSPNCWPLFHQSQVGPPSGSPPDPKAPENYVRANYIHQDMVSYAEGLLAKVTTLVDRGFEVLCATYADFKDFELNSSALRSLGRKRQIYPFRHFC